MRHSVKSILAQLAIDSLGMFLQLSSYALNVLLHYATIKTLPIDLIVLEPKLVQAISVTGRKSLEAK